MKSVLVDLCDFHAHVLPGADHGSSSVVDTLKQLKFAKMCGVSRVVATPHFYPHRDDLHNFLIKREGSFNRLMSKWEAHDVDIKVGAEVLICHNLQNLPDLHKLCIGKSRCLLLELPFNDFFEEYVDTSIELSNMGYNIVIAHADRYDPEIVDLFIKTGAKLQLNASSLCGVFKQKHLYRWLSDGKVVALGSDIHGPNKKAYEYFAKATLKIADYINEIKESSDKLWESF